MWLSLVERYVRELAAIALYPFQKSMKTREKRRKREITRVKKFELQRLTTILTRTGKSKI